MKRDRAADLHFYEWRMTAWMGSETRDRLIAAGRGIYRELLDTCYGQGRFPDDPEWICRRCACTMEEYRVFWPIIVRHFPRGEKGYRHHVPADIVRHEYVNYVNGQREKRKDAIEKARRLKEIEELPCKVAQELAPTNGNGNGNGNGNNTLTATATSKEDPQPPGAETAPEHALFDETTSDPQSLVRSAVPAKRRRSKSGRTLDDVRRELGVRLPWFEALYSVHPAGKSGVKPAAEAFAAKVTPDEAGHALAQEMYRGAKAYAARCAADPTMQVKWMQGWINDERWRDELLPVVAPKPTARQQSDQRGLQAMDLIEAARSGNRA